MTKQTKLELVQINARLAAECEALRTEVADLKLMLTMHQTPSHRVAPHMPQWQQDRATAMAAARALAMANQRVVKVQA